MGKWSMYFKIVIVLMVMMLMMIEGIFIIIKYGQLTEKLGRKRSK